MRQPFAERAADMGLTQIGAHKGCYTYEDRYAQIVYRQLYAGLINTSEDDHHSTDGAQTPLMGIFTRPDNSVDYMYVGNVSDFYQFIGNDVLCQRVRDSIQSVGMPIVTENTIMNWDLTRMRNEIIIQSSQNHFRAGDILPVMVVNNSYNGTRAATVAFGLGMQYQDERLIFSFGLGEMRQVHIASSLTQMASTVASYMTVFTDNISDMINQSFESPVSEDDMMTLLDVIEHLGKQRRDAVSSLLAETAPAVNGLPSAWQVFLAIVRYSSFEQNLNIKRLMENAAESVLVIPRRMNEVLERL